MTINTVFQLIETMVLTLIVYKLVKDRKLPFFLGPHKTDGQKSDFVVNVVLYKVWGLPTITSPIAGQLTLISQEPFEIKNLGNVMKARKKADQAGSWFEILLPKRDFLCVEVIQMGTELRINYATQVFWSKRENEPVHDEFVQIHQFSFLKALMTGVCLVIMANIIFQMLGL